MSRPTPSTSIAPASSIATTGAATLLTLFAASESHGEIVTNTSLNLPSITVNFARQLPTDWNIDGEGSAEVQFYASTYNAEFYFKRTLNSFGFVGAPGNSDLRNLSLLPSPETVSASQAFFNAATIASGNVFKDAAGFVSGQGGYIGFRFKPDDTMFYGWAAVTITPGFSGSFTLHEWAYDNTGASIHVGQTAASAIPEPADVAVGLGALALGAAGLMRWRSRKAA
ncbi:MAG TPA: hypothetical protein VNR00_01835 [Opitutus sp.]|nr:hypothetical protein [Opitutus sp.]